jgi:hypothetical protein
MTWTIWRRERQRRTNPHLLWGTLTKQALVGGGLALALVLITVACEPRSAGSSLRSALRTPNLSLIHNVTPKRQSPFSPPLSSPLPPRMSRRLPYWEEHPSPGSAMASLLGFPTNLNLQRGGAPLSLLIHSTSPTPTGTFSNGSLPHLSWLGSLVFLPILAPEPTGYATR